MPPTKTVEEVLVVKTEPSRLETVEPIDLTPRIPTEVITPPPKEMPS